MQNLAEKVFHCDDGHDKSDGTITIIAVVTILMAAAAVKGRKLATDKCSIILKALHACHFVFAFGEWVNKSDIYANINISLLCKLQ